MHPLSFVTSCNLVLNFHIVPSQDWFRRILKTIGLLYKFISIEEIESYYYAGREFNNCCHICFDDGDKTFYDNAFPVLKKENVPATLFVSPKVIMEGTNYWFQEVDYIRGRINDTLFKKTMCEVINCNYEKISEYTIFAIFKSMKLKDIFKVIDAAKQKYDIKINKEYNIKEEELDALNKSGIIAIGAHTMSHPILSNENDEDMEKEIQESVEILSMMLNKKTKYFAYPNGESQLDYGPQEQEKLMEKEIKLAFSTKKQTL